MGQIKVRQLDDWIVGVHQDMAKQAGYSLEQHLREVLRDAALANQRRFGKEQAMHLLNFKEKFGVLAESVEGIREDREQFL